MRVRRRLGMTALGVAVALLLGGAGRARADMISSTFGSENIAISPGGTPDSGASPTYGQPFVGPAGNPFLQSADWSIRTVGRMPPSGPVPTDAPFGPALFAFGPRSFAPPGGTFDHVTVSTTHTALTPGNPDIALFPTTGPNGGGALQGTPPSANPSGSFEFNNAQAFAGLSGGGGVVGGNPPANFNADSAFAMSFTISPNASAAPEPASLTLLGLGALGLAGYGWRRRQQAA
jgi:hypothetical protein